MRRTIDVPDNVLLQFAPRGSYRVENFVEWLEHDLSEAPGPEDCDCITYDYYAPHLHETVSETIESKGHCHLVKGGGCTPFIATLDTHYHAPMDKEYRKAETSDSMMQLRRSRKIPVFSKQTVLNRANDSWALVRHHSLSYISWKNNAITNALDGSEDHLISALVLPFWQELGMPEVRAQLIHEIEAAETCMFLGFPCCVFGPGI